MAKRPQKARRLAGLSNLNGWLLRHAQVSLASLGQLSRSPLPTMMTAAVLGIALALPAGLHLLLGNLQQLAGNLSGSASISLFLHQEVSDHPTSLPTLEHCLTLTKSHNRPNSLIAA